MAVKLLTEDPKPTSFNFLSVVDRVMERDQLGMELRLASDARTDSPSMSSNSVEADGGRPTKIRRMSGSPLTTSVVPVSVPTVEPVLLLRFNRSSLKSWQVTQTKIYDMPAFLQSCNGAVYLIDFPALQGELENSLGAPQHVSGHVNCTGCRLTCKDSCRFVSLEHRLLSANALVASWTVQDFPQLIGLHQQSVGCGSLLTAWRQGNLALNVPPPPNTVSPIAVVSARGIGSVPAATDVASREPGNVGHGGLIAVLAVEQSMPLLLVLRKSTSLGLVDDCWRYVYSNDLVCGEDLSMEEYLSHLFPQLRAAIQRASNTLATLSEVVVKYNPHVCPGQTAESCPSSFLTAHSTADDGTMMLPLFQTIGVLSDTADTVMSNFVNRSHFSHMDQLETICHELQLERLG
jgi:hypothetical protein